METKVDGAGRISFWWKSSCEEVWNGMKFDHVSFAVDGVEQAFLGGVGEWTQVAVDVAGSGEHMLRWTYRKDESDPAGEDCAWLDEVAWTPAETQTTAVAVPFAWLKERYPGLADAAAFEAKANEVAANGINKVWECYVAGIEPADATAEFAAKIEMVDGKPVVTWEPDMNEGTGKVGERIYRVLGKESLDAELWTEVADGEEAGYRFFKVTVDMP